MGKWRLNSAKNLYKSWWERAGWSGYKVARENGKLFWVAAGGTLQPFEVLEGEQLTWR